jgi:hypothetical protein
MPEILGQGVNTPQPTPIDAANCVALIWTTVLAGFGFSLDDAN